MSSSTHFELSVRAASSLEATEGAEELSMILVENGITARTTKDRKDTQDFGATVVAVLGTGACIALAKGIASHIARRGNEIVIRTAKGGEFVAKGDAAGRVDIAMLEKVIASLQ